MRWHYCTFSWNSMSQKKKQLSFFLSFLFFSKGCYLSSNGWISSLEKILEQACSGFENEHFCLYSVSCHIPQGGMHDWGLCITLLPSLDDMMKGWVVSLCSHANWIIQKLLFWKHFSCWFQIIRVLCRILAQYLRKSKYENDLFPM